MSNTELFNLFWDKTKEIQLNASEIALYFFLLNERRINNWRDSFECSTVKVCNKLSISKQTLVNARKRLEELGFIKFTNGSSRFQPSKYTLLDLTVDLTLLSNDDNSNYIYNINNIEKENKEKEPDILLALLSSDTNWVELIKEQVDAKFKSNIKINIQNELKDFIDFLKMSGVKKNAEEEAKRHFVNWLFKRLSNKKRKGIINKHKDSNVVKQENSVDKYNDINEW